MKSMLKILTRYVFSAAGIALILLMLNLTLLLVWFIQSSKNDIREFSTAEVANELINENGDYRLSDRGKEAINQYYQWAMLLDEKSGQVIWSEKLPTDVPREYTISDVASFSRWYLKDYPVYVWRRSDGLFVVGAAKDSMWKHGVEFPSDQFEKTITWFPVTVIINFIAALLLALTLGVRLFNSLRPIFKGIDDLALKKPVQIATSGILGDLANKLNQTSEQLQQQETALQRRDNARTTWIAGISHDIRTPLTMMMGYASQLEDNPNLSPDERQQAGIIRRQAERIKKLVNNLNLASKLEYEMQPLKLEKIDPAELVRNLVAGFLNDGLDDRYSIHLNVEEGNQKAFIQADKELLGRAVNNLIENSIQHNPDGCNILVSLRADAGHFLIMISDDGKGLPGDVVDNQGAFHSPSAIPSHGLGLILAQQILKAHGGAVDMRNLPHAGCQITLRLPIQ
jgi:signal transduction histidine kinase